MLSDLEILALFGENTNHPGRFAHSVIDALLSKMDSLCQESEQKLSAEEMLSEVRKRIAALDVASVAVERY